MFLFDGLNCTFMELKVNTGRNLNAQLYLA